MRLIKVAAIALNQTPLDWRGNTENIIRAIEAARRAGADIVCLPELCITGYGCEDAFLSADVQNRALRALQTIAPATEGMIVSIGLPLRHLSSIYNSACLLVDGRIQGFVAKQNLAGDGIHYEPRWFKPWRLGAIDEVDIDGEEYPLGDLIFEIGGVRLGFEICEDAWATSRPGRGLAVASVDVILNPSASHFAFEKQDVRRRLVLEGSRAFGVGYIYANLLGNEAGRVIYDGGTMIAAGGHMLAEGNRFSSANFTMTTAVIDVDLIRMQRAGRMSTPTVEHSTARCIECDFTFSDTSPEPKPCTLSAWEKGETVKEEEFARAVSLGLLDYLRKSRCRGFVVSLSGGADSSAVSVLVWLLVRFGLDELGRDEFLKKLAHLPRLAEAESADDMVGRLLTCVYQSTVNSGDVTRTAARTLAESIGARFLEFNVDPLVRDYIELGEQAMGRPLNWDDDDLALQNIQARARGPSAWLLANLGGALLLATSNRSEAAVGYATMDGDTCGSLSPIAGIDKAFLRRWLKWMCETGPTGIGNLPSLDLVVCQQPTAELRPSEAGQTDEADLMPYELLDTIERAAIRDKNGPIDVYRLMRVQFPHFQAEQLLEWVERFFRLWSRNQWKRERYAPSFHLDDENLDPKTWCRFPILSGGFQQELAELRDLVEAGKM